MVVALFGCRKAATTAATQKALFGLHLHTYIDSNLVSTGTGQYGQWYQDKNGRWMNITTANVYITNIGLHSATTGRWYTMPGSIMLKRLENEIYSLDSIPVDTYDNLRFTFGLGSTLNAGVPSSFSSTTGADTVLSITEPTMYAGAGNGYYFMSLAGNVDTSASHNMNHLIPFSYQLAGDTFQVSPPVASEGNTFDIIPNVPGAQLLHLVLDFGKLLQGVPINAR